MPLRQITAAEYRRIREAGRRVTLAAFVIGGFAILIAAIGKAFKPQLKPIEPVLAGVFIACWIVMAATIAAQTWRELWGRKWRCPNCDERFAYGRKHLPDSCWNCGVSLDELDPPTPPPDTLT